MDTKKHTNTRSKGVEPITTTLFIVGALLFIEGFILTNAIYKLESMRGTIRETLIINAIDFVEAARSGLHDAVEYSIYKASDDILQRGGFCRHNLLIEDAAYCEEDCKIPYETPTFMCVPWWRIYNETYGPLTTIFNKSLNNRVFQRFEEYARFFESVTPPRDEFNAPPYCPRPGNAELIAFPLTFEPVAYARLEHKDSEGNDIPMTYEGKFSSLSTNSTFQDAVRGFAITLLEFAKNKFTENDYVATKFNESHDTMPNDWCQDYPLALEPMTYVVEDFYCDLTATGDGCQADCWSDTNGGEFKDEDCCCKGMYLGYRCVESLDCEVELSKYCSYTHNENCEHYDSNCDGVTDADEWHKQSLKSIFYTPVVEQDMFGNEFETSISEESQVNCLKTGHITELNDSGIFSVHWTELEEEIGEKCQKIREDSAGNSCGCANYCTGDESNCGDCQGITAGSFSGQCPTDPPWVNKKITCPADCCAVEWTCTDTQESGACIGTNTEECPAGTCPSTCCEGGIPPDCQCDDCDLKEECKGVECPRFGPCFPDCCEWIWEGAHKICVRKDFECEPCCDGECTQKSCGSLSRADCGDCAGCFYKEGAWSHEIELNCRANACSEGDDEYKCCEETKEFAEDTRCTYNYYGTASLGVEVSDVYTYSIGTEWTNLTMPFYVSSGNTIEPNFVCDTPTTDDDPATEEIEFEEWQYCKVGEECRCDDCDLKEECKGVECPRFGPCFPDCCEWIWEGAHKICVRKDFECEPCCGS